MAKPKTPADPIGADSAPATDGANDIYSAFLEMQKELPTLSRSAKNESFKTDGKAHSYVPLEDLVEQVMPVLHKHGFIVTQPVSHSGSLPTLKTALIYAATGQAMEDEMLLGIQDMTPQNQGSAITYARRYQLMSMLGIVGEPDDDANRANKEAKDKIETAKKPAHVNKKGNIDVMLREVQLDPDEYRKTLKAAGIEWEDMTNEQADDILQKLGAYINYKRAQTAAQKTAIPSQVAPQ